jgi:hypothetical protein
MNKKITSKLWKDSRHVQGSEYSQEIRNVKAFQSYTSNPKQAFRSRKNNGVCKVFTKSERLAYENLLNFDPENKVEN